MADSKNFILAIALSIAVLFGWQFFVAGPQLARQQQEQAAAQKGSPVNPDAVPPGTSTAPVGTSAATSPSPSLGTAPTFATREEALAASPRVKIETPSISGSINLRGGRIDDVHLIDYRETTDRSSPPIVLLSPAGSPNSYFAEFGFVGATAGVDVPGPDTLWTAPGGASLTPTSPVTLSYDNGAGLLFKRTISVDLKYMFSIVDTVENHGTAPASIVGADRISHLNEPTDTGASIVLHVGPIGVIGDQGLKSVNYADVKKSKDIAYAKANNGWIGITDKYWAVTLIPEQGSAYTSRFTYFDQPAPVYQASLRTDPMAIAPGETVTIKNRLFAGAKEVALLNGYRDSLGIDRFDLLINWGWFYFFTKPLFVLLDWLSRGLGNFGLAILMVTLLIKAAFFPLANKSYKSMSKTRQIQPQIAALRERYADDKVKQQQAQMELFKKEKINPVAGCWPVLLQVPVFFSLYSVLYVTIEMRHAPFFGWIKDLSSPDPTNVILPILTLGGLIPWDPTALPVIGHFLHLGVWPLIMGITMWTQMRLNPAPPDPAQQMIFNWMPVIFTFMLAGFPAGLVIYWAWNNTLSIIQQTVIMRRQGVKVDLIDNIMATFRKKPPPIVPEKKPPTVVADDKTPPAPIVPQGEGAATVAAQNGKSSTRVAGDKKRKGAGAKI